MKVHAQPEQGKVIISCTPESLRSRCLGCRCGAPIENVTHTCAAGLDVALQAEGYAVAAPPPATVRP